jgi:hypothetical protein
VQTVLAIVPKPREVLGILHQEPFLRTPAPTKETPAQKRARPKESQVWSRAARAVGSPTNAAPGHAAPGEERIWVHVGDAYSDIFEFLEACREQETHFLVRAAYNRRVQAADQAEGTEVATHLLDYARSLPSQGERTLELPPRDKRPARQARLSIGFGPLTLESPQAGRRKPGIAAWVVRVWEPDPPAEVAEPLEWVLITSVPTSTLADAWQRVDWYTCRWLVEDYHKCLKTGCLIERRRLDKQVELFRLLGLLAPMAVQLLRLRELARLEPERLASEVLPAELVDVVARLAGLVPETLRVEEFWREVARHGGFLGRRRDGPPGWQTLWQGWLYIQTLLEGIHFAASRHPPTSG